jgi:ATP-dependent DNA helicase RecQ
LITWLTDRLPVDRLHISKENHKEREEFAKKRVDAMIRYVQSTNMCRSLYLLAYFNEQKATRCGQCDVCLGIGQLDVTSAEFDQLYYMIKSTIQNHHIAIDELAAMLPTDIHENKIVRVIRWLIDQGQIIENERGICVWEEQHNH